MWKKPAQVVSLLTKNVWHHAAGWGLTGREFVLEGGGPAEELITRWLHDLTRHALSCHNQTAFATWLRSYLCALALEVESKNLYASLPVLQARLQNFAAEMAPMHGTREGRNADGVLVYFLSALMLLLGTETRLLVGVVNNRPTWKKVPRIRPEEMFLALHNISLITWGMLHHVGPSEAWLVPDFREFDSVGKSRHEEERGYRDLNCSLLEAAFYKQRYVLDEEGVFVKLTDAQNITGIHLKVQSRTDTALVNLLARVETTEGSVFLVITEEVLLEGKNDSGTFVNGGGYLDYLVCEVYHSLVTATELPSAATRRQSSGSGEPSASGGSEPQWLVIPRRVKNVLRQPRTEIPQRSVTEPHRVTGHLRRVPMTEGHRAALRQFEQETGLQVLRFVPEGCTFVRPHISPRASAKELAALPRFIRHRIQRRLEEAMKQKR